MLKIPRSLSAAYIITLPSISNPIIVLFGEEVFNGGDSRSNIARSTSGRLLSTSLQKNPIKGRNRRPPILTAAVAIQKPDKNQ